MVIKAGLDVQKVYLGSTEIQRVYSGSDLIYDKSVFGVTLVKDGSNNLVATADGGDFDFAIYDWRVNGTSIAKANVDLRSSTAKDYSTNAITVTKQGTPVHSLTGGPDNQGFWNFPSAPNYFDITGAGNQSGTLSIWARRLTASTGYPILMGDYVESSSTGACQFLVGPANEIYWRIWDSSGWTGCTDTYAIGTTWHNFMVESGSVDGMKLFVDGSQLSATSTYTGAATLDTMQIGKYHTYANTWEGDACMMVNYNRYLSGNQKQFIANKEFHKIAAIETAGGETWSVEVTPVKDGVDGTPITKSIVI